VTAPIELAPVELPDFGVPEHAPELPAEEYRHRLAALRAAVSEDWIVVYGDREHFANLAHLCAFDPRFEEALLLVGPDGTPRLVVGLEGKAYASLVPVELDVVVCPSLSLMGQDRGAGPTLDAVLRDAGIAEGERVGVVGWKSLTPAEWPLATPALAAPSLLVDLLRHITGTHEGVRDATPALMSPDHGLRSRSSAAQIAAFEWAAARASRCVRAIVAAATPGTTEAEAVAAMGYRGEPLSAHVMFASGPEVAVGLRSPGPRRLRDGDAATTAVGFWGGLSCRAGLVAERSAASDGHAARYLSDMAIPYWRAIATWYETVGLGVPSGAVHAAIAGALAGANFAPALNPGHLIGLDEWVHSPIEPGSAIPLASGMTLQCDIIPSTARPGWAANCEDTIALADAPLRDALRHEHPEVWARIAERRRFMHDELGLALGPELLPLSSIPAWFPPFWRSTDHALRRG
jgi:hypothetical protein